LFVDETYFKGYYRPTTAGIEIETPGIANLFVGYGLKICCLIICCYSASLSEWAMYLNTVTSPKLLKSGTMKRLLPFDF